MRISDWSSDVCSSDLIDDVPDAYRAAGAAVVGAAMIEAVRRPRRKEGADGVADIGEVPLGRGIADADGRTARIERLADDRRDDRPLALDRKSVVSGKSVSIRVDLGGRRIIKKK